MVSGEWLEKPEFFRARYRRAFQCVADLGTAVNTEVAEEHRGHGAREEEQERLRGRTRRSRASCLERRCQAVRDPAPRLSLLAEEDSVVDPGEENVG